MGNTVGPFWTYTEHGLIADRPSATVDHVGKLFFATDETQTYLCVPSGSSYGWVTVSPAGSTLTVDDALNTAVTRTLTLSHTTSGVAAAGIGAGMLLRAESDAGTLRSAGAVDALHTDATDGAEVSVLSLKAGTAGTLTEGLRVATSVGATSSCQAVGGTSYVRFETYGIGADVSMRIEAKGAGTVAVYNPGNTQALLSVGPTGNLGLRSGVELGAAPTVSLPSGVVQVDSGATTVTVTNTMVAATSLIFAQIVEATSNAVSVLNVVPGAGSFVINLSGDPGVSNASVAFLVVNPL